MLISDAVKSLLENDKELCKSSINTLLKIANNIIVHPNESKFRRINLNSEVTAKTLLPAVGALEILFLMGFNEGNDALILPNDASLDVVTSYRDQLEQLKRENVADESSPQKSIRKKKKEISALEFSEYLASEAEMKETLEHHFQQVLVFESISLQENARNHIPYQMLAKKAKEREAALKTDGSSNPLNFQDCILVELLGWFKEFFTWFNNGYCDPCETPMKFLGHVAPNEEEREFGGHRVENYQCEKCGKVIRFPRYFHPLKLLQTRKGRCMEWASCFTLMCRALGLDARYIWDKTDHVWTEVFSVSQNRWIHADPCENKIDCPLMYEKGWKKKLSYVFGFSKDEVVDCVWRYSSDHKAVCSRRKSAREDWLAETLNSMCKERQKVFSEPKRNFLDHRMVREIAEFFTEPKTFKEGEDEGRSSGSLAWRLARGETSDLYTKDFTPFTFHLSEKEKIAKEMLVKYSSSQDVYVRENCDGEEIKGWKNGASECENIFRKYEADWKIVYLSRTEGALEGKLKWRFEWKPNEVQIKSVLVIFQHKTFENGSVLWQVCTKESCFQGFENCVLELSSSDFNESCTYLEVCATLSKGKGDVAWQHAQLFRQKKDDKEYPFLVKLSFF